MDKNPLVTDHLFISHSIDRELYDSITELLQNKSGSAQSCVVFLTTFGGDPDAGFRIGRCLQHHYGNLRIVIPSYCKSAGTLIAIAANELAIGNSGELGPLDVQVKNPNEMQGRNSGLDIQQALYAIDNHATSVFFKFLQALKNQVGLSTRLAGELAIKLAIGQAEPLYAQIDPLRIGELQRAMTIAKSYGEKLNEKSNSLISGALDMLAYGYPAHSHVIDRKEAKKLFAKVYDLTAEEYDLYSERSNAMKLQTKYIELKEHGAKNENSDNKSNPIANTKSSNPKGSSLDRSGAKNTRRAGAKNSPNSRAVK